MKKFIASLALALWSVASVSGQVTIDRCVSLAQQHYPLVRKYGLLDATRDVNISEINSAWLPRVAVTGQTTWQNAVPTFPASLAGMMAQMKAPELKGLPRWQYRAGVEVGQTLWDGGASRRRSEMERASTAASSAALDVELYAVRERVEGVYFGILLLRDQLEQTRLTHELLMKNLDRVRAAVRAGAALQADADMIEAQALTLEQQMEQARSAEQGYLRVLELFTGEAIGSQALVRPEATVPADLSPQRPELKLLDARRRVNMAALNLADVSLMPKVGLFAQGFYGNPGLDNFKSMTDSKGSFNIIGGVKATWNIDAFYTRRDSQARTALANDMLDAERATLLHNLNIQSASQQSAIGALEKVKREDAKIISLRRSVRQAAEAQLAAGVIDATALIAKITDESIAELNARYHDIQLIQEIYRLKYTLNR